MEDYREEARQEEEEEVRQRPVDERKVREGARRIEVTAEMDAYGIEAFRLEIRRLATRYGAVLGRFRAERMPGKERRRPHAR